MSTTVRFFKNVANRPLEAIEGIVAIFLFFSGLWLATPYFWAAQPGVDEVTYVLAIVFGIVQIVMAVVLGYALLRFHSPWRIAVRRWTTFTYFILLMFYALTGMMNHGFERITWTMTFAMALIMGVCHIRLKWVDAWTEDARD